MQNYFLACTYADGSNQCVSVSFPLDFLLDFVEHLIRVEKLDPEQPIYPIEDF